MGVHLGDRRLQPRQNAEPGLHATSSGLTPGKSVSERRTAGIWRQVLAEILEHQAAEGLHGAIQERNTPCQPSFFRILLSAFRLPSSLSRTSDAVTGQKNRPS